jgi:hypothetical protein
MLRVAVLFVIKSGEFMSLKKVVAPRARAVVACAVAAAISFNSIANSLTAGPLVGSTDFGLFGVSGLRGVGAGSITVSGVTGTVTRAILVWHGVASSSTALTRGVTVGSTAFVGTNIGLSDNNCWGQSSSQAFSVDVTSAVTGNGTYALSNLRTAGTFDPNGASLLVYYNDGNSTNNRDIAVFWGNDSNITNSFDAAGWSATLSGINYSSGAANLSLIVSDGQAATEGGTATINTAAFSIPEFAGNTLPLTPGSTVTTGGLWDHYTSSVSSYLVPGPNTLNFSASLEGGDCLSLVGAVFDLPAGTVTPPTGPAPVVAVPVASSLGVGVLGMSIALWGVYALRSNRRRSGVAESESRKENPES